MFVYVSTISIHMMTSTSIHFYGNGMSLFFGAKWYSYVHSCIFFNTVIPQYVYGKIQVIKMGMQI